LWSRVTRRAPTPKLARRQPAYGYSGAIGEALQQRQAIALVTVVRASPFLQRGARLLVTDASSEGTLGALAVDALAVQAARQALAGATDRPFRLPLHDAAGAELGEAFVELYLPSPRLLILGAGHIAQPLAKVAKLLDFEVVVLDDRAAFANRARFPDADEVLGGGLRHDAGNLPGSTAAPLSFW